MITIAGYGFVGKAHEQVLKDKFNITIYDPPLGFNDFGSPKGVIVCVSTPSHSNGSCNVNHVAEVISITPTDVPILIRSTISLEGWQDLKKLYPKHKLAFAPEFLRAATAIEDFNNTQQIYIGGDDTDFWHDLFHVVFDNPNFTVEIATVEELILAKYFRNSFLATKVSFFNQVYDLCNAIGIDYSMVQHLISSDPRIGKSHTEVTQERGFGGHCFPKDTAAVLHTSNLVGINLSLIDESVKYNKTIRKLS